MARGFFALFICALGAAVGRAEADGQDPQAFDGERAFQHLRAQCAFGPRVPGTRAHDQAGEYLAERFRELGLATTIQSFTARPALLGGRPALLRNIIARLEAPGRPSVIVTAHWDSRPTADMDPNPANARLPIEGANDGASGAAVVLELARVFQEKPTTHGLVFALCDGEDLGSLKAPKDWCLGSKHLAERLEPAWGVRLAINVDMVGDRHLAFTRELYGQRACPQFSDFCWSVGQEIAPEAFGGGSSRPVFDDHASFLRVGIPSFDLIDFDYEGWHTQGDVIERCSARSLQTAGRVVEAILRRLETENWGFCVGPLPADMNRY